MADRVTRVALLLAALLSLASCGRAARPQTTAPPSPSSGIYGIAVTGPLGLTTKPSPLPGGFGKSLNVPIANARLVVKDGGGAVVARATADEQGIFRLSLPPGTYAVWGTSLSKVKTKVVVKPGTYTRAVCYAYFHY